jgi:hypothetical protein
VNLGGLDVSNGQAGAGSGSGHAGGEGSENSAVRVAAAAPGTAGVSTAAGLLPEAVAGTVNVIA